MEQDNYLSLCPKGTKRLSHQIAGHSKTKFGMLKHIDGTVLKPLQGPPRGPRELNFYETIFNENCTDPILINLRPLLPRFYDNQKIEFKNQELSFIKLEDITERFQNPCILDVKIGPQTYDPDADSEKIKIEKKKYPPVEKIGYRILGMRVYKKTGEVIIRDKDYGKKLDEHTVLDGLLTFLDSENGLELEVIKQFLSALHNICEWFESQHQLAFYSSSLLLVYEGKHGRSFLNNSEVQGNTEWNASSLSIVDIKMIDFTHVFPTNSLDENYLFGLRNLISHFKQIYQRALYQNTHNCHLTNQ